MALTGCFMLVCHPRFSGRPAAVLALERLVEHIQGHEGVWFARCDQVAACVGEAEVGDPAVSGVAASLDQAAFGQLLESLGDGCSGGEGLPGQLPRGQLVTGTAQFASGQSAVTFARSFTGTGSAPISPT